MSSLPREIADGVFVLRTAIVNVYLVRTTGSSSTWTLIDAGLSGYASSIRAAARHVAGSDVQPAAVILTHGHFDHVGSLSALLKDWSCPVYAHRLERPFLTGVAPYPPPDPLVGRGVVALASRLYPRGPFDFKTRLDLLPADGSVPSLPEWRWLHTPGHTAGHVSLYRGRDRTLIAGDAVTTTKPESVTAVATQRREMHGPPAYFTQDWQAAARSVQELASLPVDLLASGHGEPLHGRSVRDELRALAERFERTEIPRHGRYVHHAAVTDEHGIVSLPPDPLPRVAAAIVAAAGLTYVVTRRRNPQRG